MMDYSELVKSLRICVNGTTCVGCIKNADGTEFGCKPLGDSELVLEAADAIEELQRPDNISLHMAVETKAWAMVWAADPLRKVNVEMTYQDLWNIAKSIWGGYLPREEIT